MYIKNFKKLAKNDLRKKALLVAEAGYNAIDIKKSIAAKCKLRTVNHKTCLFIKAGGKEEKINLDNFKRIFLVGVGKGSALASASLVKILGNKLTGGIALDIQKPKFKIKNLKLKILVGTHPLPSRQNIKATRKIIELVKNLKKDDLLVAFICGGGSALLCGSEKEMKNSILATKLLTRAGADILELNTVREHLSDVKGGGLAKLAYPATVVSLIVSDVLGNDLSMIASGPTVFNKTSKKDAEKILKKYGLNSKKFHFIETPKNKKYFKKACLAPKQGFWCGVKNILFLSNREPIMAMAKKAKKIGFKPKIYSYSLQGEAKDILLSLFKTLPYGEAPKAILAGGETIVTLRNPKSEILNPKQIPNSKFQIQKIGKGGRNMEAVLGAIAQIQNSKFKIQNSIILSFASDGRDNTEAAGAIGDVLTIQKAQRLKLNSQKYLNSHSTFNFFKKTGDLIFIEPKTFNVADLMLVLSASKE